jgi:hypothetical protein
MMQVRRAGLPGHYGPLWVEVMLKWSVCAGGKKTPIKNNYRTNKTEFK